MKKKVKEAPAVAVVASEKTSPVKNKKAKDSKKLEEVNLAKATKDAKEKEMPERETKWIYPEDVKTSERKKEFRRKARAARDKYESTIKRLTKSKDADAPKELKKTEAEYSAWKKEYVTAAQG